MVPPVNQPVSRFAAWFRRNQLMILITGSFIMLLFLTGVFVLAMLRNNAVQEQRRQDSREQILCILDKSTSPNCDQAQLDIKGLSEQNKKLAEDNIFLSDRKIYYLKCLGKMFVQWTQTQPPLKLNSLSECEFTVNRKDFSQSFQPTLNDTRNIPMAPAPDKSKETNATPSPRPEPQPNEPPTPPPVAQRCTIDLLGIKLLCENIE